MTPSTYHPSRIAPRVTDAHKLAVWNAIAPPARLTVDEIAEATGLHPHKVMDVLAAGRLAGRIEIHDEDRQHAWIGRKVAS